MQKNQHQMCPTTPYGSSSLGQVHPKSSIFGLPRLFLGLNPKCTPDYSDYSVNSPTSPLDAQIFSNAIKSPRSPSQKIWDCEKVGLSLIDSIGDDGLKIPPGKIHQLSDVKNIVFGPQLRIITQKFGNSSQSFVSLNEGGNFSVPRRTFASSNGKNLPTGSKVDARFRSYEAPRSLPKNFAFPHTQSKSPLRKGSSNVVFEIGDSLGDSKSASKPRKSALSSPQPSPKGSKRDGFSILSSVSEIELSEDYTCVTVHGPEAQTRHIYADCILSCKSGDSNCGTSMNKRVASDAVIVNNNPDTSASYPFDEFFSLCGMCKKTLAADKDIYIYRGEKSFCSPECRSRAILMDDEKVREDSLEPINGQEFSEADILGTY